VDELRLLITQLAAKVLPEVPIVNAGVAGSPPAFADVLVAPPGGVKSSLVETQDTMEVNSDLGRVPPMGGGFVWMEALRSMAMEFLAKVRADVDRVICFGLGLKINASKDIRSRLGRVFSRLGLKPKLLHGFILRGRRKRLTTRGLSYAVSRVKPNGGGEWDPDSDPDQGETSSEKTEEAMLVISGGDDVIMGSGTVGSDEAAVLSGKGAVFSSAKSMIRHDFLRHGFSLPTEEEAVKAPGSSKSSYSREVSSKMDPSGKGAVFTLAKRMLRHSFLRPRFSSLPEEEAVQAPGSSELSYPGEVSLGSFEVPEMDPDLGGGLFKDVHPPPEKRLPSVAQGKHFSFPPLLEDAPTFYEKRMPSAAQGKHFSFPPLWG
jgi:hypothetical protein